MIEKLKKIIYNNFSEKEINIEQNVDSSIKCYLNNTEMLYSVLVHLKKNKYIHLSDITAIDKIKENKFEIIYNIFSYELKQRVFVIVKIDRSTPEIITIEDIWSQAQAYEQLIHEFFGIVFNGNPDLSGLILHNWLDIPPLRKDFDSQAYCEKAYVVDQFPEKEVSSID